MEAVAMVSVQLQENAALNGDGVEHRVLIVALILDLLHLDLLHPDLLHLDLLPTHHLECVVVLAVRLLF